MATQAQRVRDWATAQGHTVGTKGRIAPAIWTAYAEAHEGFERETPQSGTALCDPGCGRRWTGLNECHCRRCHAHFSTVANFDAHLVDGKCVPPLEAKIGGVNLKAKDTVWGVIYVRDGDYWKNQTDLLD